LGSTVVIIVRTTNSATGTPAFSVSSNTAGDTYTATAVQTNASDGAHGSSLCVLYTTNSKGSASNAITVTATNSTTQIAVTYLEYAAQGMGTGGLDTAAVGTTGNSTAPASGNWETTSAGDLIISCFASAANIGAVPVMSTAGFFCRTANFNATQGSLAVADNFGNGALSAGVVNFIVAGTEE
jgi:hypothetical protein